MSSGKKRSSLFYLAADGEGAARAPGVRPVAAGVLLEGVAHAAAPQHRPGSWGRRPSRD